VANITDPPTPLTGAGEHEDQRALLESGDQRASGEDRDAHSEHAPAAEQIGERARRQQQRGEAEREALDGKPTSAITPGG
jgi:hypothetical protein